MSLPSHLVFTSLTFIQDLAILQVRHPLFSADIALQGAQLLSFKPRHNSKQDTDWIWLSPEAEFRTGQSLRGGIPICWPWFGVANKNPSPVANAILPSADEAASHGFARSMEWEVRAITETCHGVTVELGLSHDESTLAVWPFEFDLVAKFELGRTLNMQLVTTNLSQHPFTISQALHTYFPCSDISKVTILGSESARFTDALNHWQLSKAETPQRFNQEVDRIYHTGGPFTLSTGSTPLSLTAENSNSTIIWNPWIEKSQRLGQFGDERYKEMFCVETANALEDVKQVEPGEHQILGLHLSRA